MIGGFARNILSRDGRKYKDKCVKLIAEQVKERKILVPSNGCLFSGRLQVSLLLCAPTRRACDVDNYSKATLDALTASKVWQDDGQVDVLYIKRGPIVKGGAMRVHIMEL